MAQVWEWETCHLWIEPVFTMMDNGWLPLGWHDLYTIKTYKEMPEPSAIRGTYNDKPTQ